MYLPCTYELRHFNNVYCMCPRNIYLFKKNKKDKLYFPISSTELFTFGYFGNKMVFVCNFPGPFGYQVAMHSSQIVEFVH
jgi:hypothetical protein